MTKEEKEIIKQAEAIKKKETKKKKEYSKVIVAIVLSFCIIVTLFSMVIMWVTKDTSALAYLIPSVFGETGAVIAFYLKKSERENVNKNRSREDDTYENQLEAEVI